MDFDKMREQFLQGSLRQATFERAKVTIYTGQLPERKKNEPVLRYVLDGETLWRVVSIDNDTVVCREATNQELADIQEGQKEQP